MARSARGGGLAWRLLLVLLLAGAAAKKKKKPPPPPPLSAAHVEAMGHHQRGTMAHVQGDRNGAKKAFRAAIAAKPDFAYAYYRLGFVVHEQAQILRGSGKKAAAAEDPVPLFRAAIALDGADEMFYHALGQALRDRGRGGDRDRAEAVYRAALSFNPRSAQSYWALGKLHADGRDEFESDPEDEADPTQFYERAAALRPDEYGADGSRIRRVEPNTPEREERLDREGRERREAFLQGMKDGTRTVNYAESATPKPRKLKKPR